MTATLTFNLPEDQNDFTLSLHGPDFYNVLLELDEAMRSRIKYGSGPATTEECRQILHNLLSDRNLSLEMMQ